MWPKSPQLSPAKTRNLQLSSHNSIKLVIVGDDGVGKTCLLTAYAEKKFPVDYISSVYGGFAESVVVEGEPFTLGVFDSAGKSDYDRLRPLSYPQTDVFLVCFRVNLYASFDNVKEKWFPEVHHHCPDIPCVVVATQIDLRDEFEAIERTERESPASEKRGFPPITTAQGERLARELEAAKYVECSAKTQQGSEKVISVSSSRRSIKRVIGLHLQPARSSYQ